MFVSADRRDFQSSSIDAGDRTSSSSRVRIDYLSPASKRQRVTDLINDKRMVSRQLDQLSFKLKEGKESQMVAITSDNTKQALKEAFDHITSSVLREQH